MTRWIGMTMLLALAAAAPARAELKIGVVDMQRALNDCDAGKKARDQVKAKFEKAQDQLKRQREDLDRLRGDYDKKAVVLKEEERRNLEKDLENRTLEFKRKYEDFQRDLKRTDSELTAGIVDELYFVGHFPGAPVLPGVLVCEALVQLGMYLAGEEAKDLRLLTVDRARFRRPAVPGDALRLEVTRRAPGAPWQLRGVVSAGT